ncbi:MAG: hypothetical protein LBQ08_03705 [Holosporaceae bacterium]|jgi:hypothetical protein|nr:hypothetical protein [Holosporaceae bacterium]
MYKVLISCFILVGCCAGSQRCLNAERHAEKLYRHFSGKRAGDVSTLIMETRAVSAQLKASGMHKQANKFDSYIDVLMYGNKTIDESINDVIKLVKYHDNCVCSVPQRALAGVCSLF